MSGSGGNDACDKCPTVPFRHAPHTRMVTPSSPPFDWHAFVPDPIGRTWHDPWKRRDEPACAICGVGESRAIHHEADVRGRRTDLGRSEGVER